MRLREILKKQGGINLFIQYWKCGALFTAITEFLLLGKSRTALEIIRLSATLKTKQKLERRYRKRLEEFDKNWKELPHESSNKVWVCWFQGMENAPTLVRRCYESIKENMPNRDIVVITSKNMSEYIQLPDYILRKWKNGQITHTHMTDLLRLELLIKYGGLWIDATVFCSGKNIPDYMVDSELFFFQCLKPGRDGHSNYISSWFISAKTNNKILMAVRDLIFQYWKEKSSMWDYYLLHDFMAIVLDKYPEEWNKVVPRDNATPHILLLRLFQQYDEEIWNALKEQTQFHKLTYKFGLEDSNKENTYYSNFIKRVI